MSAHTCHTPYCWMLSCAVCAACAACRAPYASLLRDPPGEPSPEETATLARIHGRLTHGAVAQADEWAPTLDDPRRCKRCQRTRCECFVTDAAQARASLPDVVRR